MKRQTLSGLLTLVLLISAKPAVLAQEFRITTRVYNESSETGSGRAPVISRSLSLFHAGKVYDYIDTVDEIIIFEPAHHRFTILNTRRAMAAHVHFDEVKRLLKLRRSETQNYLSQLDTTGNPVAERVSSSLLFQMDPQFEEKFDAERNQLLLDGGLLRYRVECADHDSAEVVQAYLAYADWIARLNSVLHPQSLSPESRLALNASLRKLGKVPTEVELHAAFESDLHLRARHKFGWHLDRLDRSLIHKWETLLKDDALLWTTFPDYQLKLLTSISE